MSYQFIDESATILKVIVGSDELLFKKVYCSTSVEGDYFILNTHEYESSIYRQEFRILYSDSINPSVGSATALQTAVDNIINNYAGGGTSGSGITHVNASGTDTYTATITGVTSYTDGDAYLIQFTNGNTTASTLNINGLGAIQLNRNNDGQIIGGDIQANAMMLVVYNSGLNVFQCVGTSPNTIISYVTNGESISITKGQAVYAFGGVGDRMKVKLAYNTSDATSAQTVGLVLSSSIGANQKGLIIMQGLLDGLSILPTSTFADGDTIYLGSTAGSITKTKPYAPNHLVYLGVVTTASAGSAGRMYVRPQNGYELDELHNVQAQSPTNKDTIYFDSASNQWKTASLATILGYTPANASTAVTSVTGTSPILSSGGTTPAISLPVATSSANGYLSSADWSTFNNKVGTARTINTTAPLSGGGDLSANRTLAITQATTSADGYLSSTDWNTFNGRGTSWQQFRKAGRWYNNGIFTPANASFTNLLNTIRYVPVYIDQDITVTRMGINVVTAAAAGNTCRLAIYSNDSATCQPLNRLVDAGTLAIDATGAKSVTGLSVSLTKGLYWFAVNASIGSGTITGIGTNFILDVKGQANISGVGFAGFNQTFTYGAFPATAGTLTEAGSTGTVCIYYYS